MTQHETPEKGLLQGLVAYWELDNPKKTTVKIGTTVLIKDNTMVVWNTVLSDGETENRIKLPHGRWY